MQQPAAVPLIEHLQARPTTARCAHGHEWPTRELFTEHGQPLPERVCPSHCPVCHKLFVALID